METKWTPGPWSVIMPPKGYDVLYPLVQRKGSGGFEVRAFEPERAIADAHLIAAAPDLYEAVMATEALDDRDSCEECGGEGEPEACGLCFPKADDARLKRRAALSKARGDSPTLRSPETERVK